MNYITGPALLELEREHLIRLLVWAVGSMVVGALCWALARRDRAGAGDAGGTGGTAHFWRHVGIQSAAWGAVDAVIVALAWQGLAVRDLPGAIALDRVLWLNIGLDVGYAMVGATLLVLARRSPPRPGLAGAGAAIIVQGVALAALDAYLSARIVH